MTEDNLNAEVIIRFVINNVINQNQLEKYYKGSLEDCVKELIREEGIFGLAEDDFTILEIKKL